MRAGLRKAYRAGEAAKAYSMTERLWHIMELVFSLLWYRSGQTCSWRLQLKPTATNILILSKLQEGQLARVLRPHLFFGRLIAP